MFKKKAVPADESYLGEILVGASEMMSKDNNQKTIITSITILKKQVLN